MHLDTLPKLFTGVAAHRPVERPVAPGTGLAAVSAVFRPADAGDYALLFIERAKQSGDPWSGQMAFPGGRMEPGDGSALATAIRETLEEVGIDLERHARLIGRLDDVQGMARGRPIPLIIRPHVFLLERAVAVRPNASEVAAPVWIPVSWLLSRAGEGTMDYPWHGRTVTLPCLRYRGHTVWGLTYRMLSVLLDLMAAPARRRETSMEHAP